MCPAFHEFAYWLRRYRRTWAGSAVFSVLNPLLFLTGVGLGLGRLVDQSGHQPIAGVSYLAFFAPGLLAASSMQTAFVEATRPVFSALHTNRTFRAAVVTPMRPVDVLTGHLLFVAFRLATTGTVFLLVMTALGATRSATGLLAVPAAVLTGLAFAAPAEALSAWVNRADQLTTVFRFVIMPLYLFSGTFFSIARLPAGIAWLAYATPLWHGVELCRGFSLATATAGSVLVHTGYLVLLTAVGALVAARCYRRQLNS